MKTEKHIKAWHFCAGNKLRDGTSLVVGKTYMVKGPLVMCEHGLHWSRRIIYALQYAPGDTICLVESWGDVQEQEDKGVSTHRKVLAKVSGKKLLRLFACDCAEEALTLWKVTDKRSWDAIEVSRRYANGKATKEELAAAWDAARAAASDAASDAAWAAARAAARAAASDAASDAARAAAWDAARAAAWAAASDAAWAAASDAASDAAWASAMDAQNDKLTTLVLAAMKRKA
jgi:hypothetical protein